MRGCCISFASNLSKRTQWDITYLEGRIRQLEILQKNSFEEHRGSLLASVKAELKDLLSTRAEFVLLKTRKTYYEQSERPGRLLALQLKQSERLFSINAIRDSTGVLFSDPSAINNIFKDFNCKLYKSKLSVDTIEINNFLKPLDLFSLAPHQVMQLDAPISLEELKEAVISMRTHKSPGLDGIPPELMVAVCDLVGPIFLKSVEYSLELGTFHRD